MMLRLLFGTFVVLSLKSASAGVAVAAEPSTSPIDFSRDVFPILRRSCFECHGHEKQEGDLRLDQRAAALKGGASGATFIAGRPDESELLRRVSLPKDDAEVMPARGETLSAREIDVLRRWIAAGAAWPEQVATAKHWSYVPPQRPQLPQNSDPWIRTPVDAFVLDRLRREGLTPSPEADPETLVRRLYLDLIGLPPSPAEVEHFARAYSTSPGLLVSPSPGLAGEKRRPGDKEKAYEELVDALLASPQFGERWARPWLDLARYADSHGFQRDDLRSIWPYRDWVIRALNADMPFDRFTIEQIAGDLLPDATDETRIATGFHRCTTTNVEAGSEPEETRVNQVFDRVNTTGAVWLGTTLECCQCHDHKYDPFSQREYYQLFAYFNNTELEADRTNPKVPGSIAFRGPSMELGDPQVVAQRKVLEADAAKLQAAIDARTKALTAELPTWETRLAPASSTAAQAHVLRPDDIGAEQGSEGTLLEDGSIAYYGEDPPETDVYKYVVRTNLKGIRAIRLEALTDKRLPGEGPGRGDPDRPNFVLNSFEVTAAPADKPGESRRVEFRKATASFSQSRYDAAGAVDDDAKTAWAINPRFHEPHWALFETAEPVGFDGDTILTFRLTQNFGGSRLLGRGRLTALTGNVAGPALPESIAKIIALKPKDRDKKQRAELLEYCFGQDGELTKLRREQTELQRELRKLQPTTTLVMRELDEARPSTVFMRGVYTTPGDAVRPGVPSVLGSLSAESPNDRLALARWLVDRDNPLTARVTVNRWWAELFGHGIVATVEDFGIKGELPTHPELLDWLAVEFMEGEGGSGPAWSMKHLLRQIVLSSTYRQSSRRVGPSATRDDRNLLYSRGPRLRLDAEMIRDNALAIAGLLSRKQFGPPIKPPQPDGLWTKVGGEKYEYVVSPGEEKYRRGLYVVWKRGSPYPSFVNFDASQRTACTVRRSRSNTPLQALTLLNDPVYVEAATALAARIVADQSSGDVADRLSYGFQLCTARSPTAAELKVLKSLYEAQVASHGGDAKAERRAWFDVATALLNLDETITKE